VRRTASIGYALQRRMTCVSFLVEIEISKVSVHELSGSVSVEFTSNIILEIYRLGLDIEIEGVEDVPDSIGCHKENSGNGR